MHFLPLRSAPSGPKFVGVNQDDTLLWDTTAKAWYVGPGGGAGAVTSVFGRVGAVVAATGDYDSDQVDNLSGVPGASISDALDNLAAAIATELPLPDGTLGAPSLAFANDLTLGLYRDPVTGLMGLVRDGFEVFAFGDDTIANLEPVPSTIRYAMRTFVPPIDGVNESTVFYSRQSYSVGEQQQSFLYFEIDDTQVDTYGGAIKGVHAGHGDAIYIALFNDGIGVECATFEDGSRGFLSSYQEPLVSKPNCVLYSALWEAAFVPNFGMFFADASYGNAFSARKMAGASDGVTQYRLIDLDSRQRWGVYGDGAVAVSSLAADAGNLTRESPEYRTEGAYWDGAVTQSIGHAWKTVVTDDSPATAELRFYARPSGVLLGILRDSGGVGQWDMQLGSLVNIASIQSLANRDDYAAGAHCSTLNPPAADLATALSLRVQAVGGVESVELLTVGPNDSGGLGKAVVVVDNQGSELFTQTDHFTNIGDGFVGFASTVSGTVATVTQGVAPANRVGIAECQTGTDTTGRASIIAGTSNWLFGGGVHYWRSDATLSALSDGTDTYTARMGYIDSATGDGVDGAFFRYIHSVNSGNWVCVTRSNNVETPTNTAVPPVAGTYQKFEIIVNAAATSVEFYIDGALVATNVATIPSGAGRTTGMTSSIIKSAGNTSRSLSLDLIKWSFAPS